MDVNGWLVVKDVLVLGWSAVTCLYILTANSTSTWTDEAVCSLPRIFWHVDEVAKFKLLWPLVRQMWSIFIVHFKTRFLTMASPAQITLSLWKILPNVLSALHYEYMAEIMPWCSFTRILLRYWAKYFQKNSGIILVALCHHKHKYL